jgi:hypothetical protein
MDIERETLLQIVVATVGVVVFTAAAVYAASTYTVGETLSAQGGIAVVGAIGLFIVVMTVAGLWLERQNF